MEISLGYILKDMLQMTFLKHVLCKGHFLKEVGKTSCFDSYRRSAKSVKMCYFSSSGRQRSEKYRSISREDFLHLIIIEYYLISWSAPLSHWVCPSIGRAINIDSPGLLLLLSIEGALMTCSLLQAPLDVSIDVSKLPCWMTLWKLTYRKWYFSSKWGSQ